MANFFSMDNNGFLDNAILLGREIFGRLVSYEKKVCG
jgi:hypothetical protein